MYPDAIFNIAEFLTDYEKISLSMTSIPMNKLKYIFIYRDRINFNKITHLPYYDNFEFIDLGISDAEPIKFPKSVKYIYCINFFDIYYYGVTHLLFCAPFNHPMGDRSIPVTVTHLTFDSSLNQCIENRIPSSVTHLTFGSNFNTPIKKNHIPQSVTHLTFGYWFNQPIKNCIPSSVTHLTFGNKFDMTVKNCIPKSVTYLTFGNNFNQSLKDSIPQSVTHLTFGDKFNKSIKFDIPTSVTHLTLGSSFTQPIQHCIQFVTHLTVGPYFHNTITGVSSLVELTVYESYDLEKKARIPPTTKVIRMPIYQ
jgi:hypothetical protein